MYTAQWDLGVRRGSSNISAPPEKCLSCTLGFPFVPSLPKNEKQSVGNGLVDADLDSLLCHFLVLRSWADLDFSASYFYELLIGTNDTFLMGSLWRLNMRILRSFEHWLLQIPRYNVCVWNRWQGWGCSICVNCSRIRGKTGHTLAWNRDRGLRQLTLSTELTEAVFQQALFHFIEPYRLMIQAWWVRTFYYKALEQCLSINRHGGRIKTCWRSEQPEIWYILSICILPLPTHENHWWNDAFFWLKCITLVGWGSRKAENHYCGE